MERAGRIISKLRIKAVEVAGVKSYHLAPGAWAAAVGKTIASHAKPVFLDRSKLIVEVEDAIWQAQLSSLRNSIIHQLDKIVGAGMITSLEFRIAPPRRRPVREDAPLLAGVQPPDEADQIVDPVMRRVYRLARKKATA